MPIQKIFVLSCTFLGDAGTYVPNMIFRIFYAVSRPAFICVRIWILFWALSTDVKRQNYLIFIIRLAYHI
jgi:hypothetical protein